MKELLFLVHKAEESGEYAEAVALGIFAEGETLKELNTNIKSGIECYYDIDTF